jgi:hypothetical protein
VTLLEANALSVVNGGRFSPWAVPFLKELLYDVFEGCVRIIFKETGIACSI